MPKPALDPIPAALAALVLAAPAIALAAPRADAAQDLYPAGARAAGVDGEATIRCARDAHLALKDCTLVSESPAGQGFGAAALAMAARSPDNPRLDVTEPALLAPQPITVHFRAGQVDPDLAEMAHIVRRPQFVSRPSPEVMARYYPEQAAKARIGGSAELRCHVTRDGRLTGCLVLQETPPLQNFAAASSLVAEREYRMTPLLVDGQPTNDGQADLTIDWTAK